MKALIASLLQVSDQLLTCGQGASAQRLLRTPMT